MERLLSSRRPHLSGLLMCYKVASGPSAYITVINYIESWNKSVIRESSKIEFVRDRRKPISTKMGFRYLFPLLRCLTVSKRSLEWLGSPSQTSRTSIKVWLNGRCYTHRSMGKSGKESWLRRCVLIPLPSPRFWCLEAHFNKVASSPNLLQIMLRQNTTIEHVWEQLRK